MTTLELSASLENERRALGGDKGAGKDESSSTLAVFSAHAELCALGVANSDVERGDTKDDDHVGAAELPANNEGGDGRHVAHRASSRPESSRPARRIVRTNAPWRAPRENRAVAKSTIGPPPSEGTGEGTSACTESSNVAGEESASRVKRGRESRARKGTVLRMQRALSAAAQSQLMVDVVSDPPAAKGGNGGARKTFGGTRVGGAKAPRSASRQTRTGFV